MKIKDWIKTLGWNKTLLAVIAISLSIIAIVLIIMAIRMPVRSGPKPNIPGAAWFF